MAIFERTAEGRLQLNRVDLDIVVYGELEKAQNARELEFIYDSISSVLEVANEQCQEKLGVNTEDEED